MYLKTDRLAVGYNGKPLIHDINIEVEKGKILTLIGPNGSGKSTILKSITRHLEKISGVVYIDRRSMSAMSNKDAAKILSVVFTDRISPELMTCGDVVAAGRYPYTNYFGRLTDEDMAIVTDSLEKVHAVELREQSFGAISDGQRQRIMLARAICQQPEIIVLDEPTSFLDIRHKIELLNILREMATQKKITVIMSLHEIDLAPKISDLVMCVKGDTILKYGTPDEIFTEETIQELYSIENGSYNMLFGSVELSKPTGEPRVFVVSGGGCAIPYFRALQKNRIPFAAGILNTNDVDYQVAAALAGAVFQEEAFCPISDRTYERTLEYVRHMKCIIDTGVVIRSFNTFNGRLLENAQSLRIPVVRGIGNIPEVLSLLK